MRLKGDEFRRWRDEDLPSGFDFANPDAIPEDDALDSAVVDTSLIGRLVWQEDPALDPTGGRGLPLAQRIRAWRRRQATPVLAVARTGARPVDAKLAAAGIALERGVSWRPRERDEKDTNPKPDETT